MFSSLTCGDDDDGIIFPPPSSPKKPQTPNLRLPSKSYATHSLDDLAVISVAAEMDTLPQYTGELQDFRQIDTGRGKSRVRVLRSDDDSPHIICSDRGEDQTGSPRRLHRYDSEGRHIVEYVEHRTSDVIGLALFDDFLVSGGDSGLVRVWDHRSGKPMADLPNAHSQTKDIWCDRMSDTVLVVGCPSHAREYSLYNNKMIAEYDTGHASTVKAVRTIDHLIITCSCDTTTVFWDRTQEREVRSFKTQEGRGATALALSGNDILLGCGAGWIELHDLRKEGLVNSWNAHPTGSCWVWEIAEIDASLGWFVSVSDHDLSVTRWRTDGKVGEKVNTGASNWGVCVWNPGRGIDYKLVAESLEERIVFLLNFEPSILCCLVKIGPTGVFHLVTSLPLLQVIE